MAVSHGGNLLEMARQYNSDIDDWVDLSTGVSPFTYPVGEIPESVWNQLPQSDDGLEAAAKLYYNASSEPVAVAGSQAAIMALPGILTEQLCRCGVVALPRVGYKEHEHAWRSITKNNKHWSITYYDELPSAEQIQLSDVVVIINPNNPTARLLNSEQLYKLQSELANKNTTLIIDEAFADIASECSILDAEKPLNNLIVLRSVGKFFGLAGARVGFLFANIEIKEQLQRSIGPWTVSGPSRWVLQQALADTTWQKNNKEKIHKASQRLEKLLNGYLALPMAGTWLFKTVYVQDAVRIHDFLCKQQILCRLCDEKDSIRFGLPANEVQWQRLELALIKLSKAL